MGSGVSKPGSSIVATTAASTRHSDSRVDQVHAELAKEALIATGATGGGNATFTLNRSLHEFAKTALGLQDKPEAPKKRAHSLPGINHGGGWGKRGGPSSSPVQAIIGSLDEMQDEVDIGPESLATTAIPKPGPGQQYMAIASSVLSSPRTTKNGDDSDEEFYEDDFEDEIGEWKKGDSIGSGSYGTVSLWVYGSLI